MDPLAMEALAVFFFLFFLLATAIQLLYWLGIFRRLHSAATPVSISTPAPVSVVICARNEAPNLRQHLPAFLKQQHPQYEVVVVNDHSSDESLDVLLDFQKEYPNLAVLNVDSPHSGGKKRALAAGIEAARFDNVVLSDADCSPASPAWLQSMASPLSSSAQLVLGYGAYRYQPGWLNRWQRFETIYTAIQYFSFAISGVPYMGVGRNLAYRKSLFTRYGQLRGFRHLLSGDDDLFVNRAARPGATAWVLNPDAFTWSVPVRTWRGYYRQKKRHLSVGHHYRREHQWLLAMFSVSHLAHYGLGALVIGMHASWWPLVLSVFGVRMVVVATIGGLVSASLKARDLAFWFWLLDGLLCFYYLLFAPVLFTGSRFVKQWK